MAVDDDETKRRLLLVKATSLVERINALALGLRTHPEHADLFSRALDRAWDELNNVTLPEDEPEKGGG